MSYSSGTNGALPDLPKAVANASALAATFCLIGILAWVQFPVASNRPWSWSLLTLLVAMTWLVWIPFASIGFRPQPLAHRRIAIPAALLVLVVAWSALQAMSWMPKAWHNAIWQTLAQGAGISSPGAISMNPFATLTETMKLATYLSFGGMVYSLALDHNGARRFHAAIAIVGVLYALYGFALSILGTSQGTIFEGTPAPYGRDVTGAFVSKNSFATFTGMALIVSLVRLFDLGRPAVVTSRGLRQLLATLIQFLLGDGLFSVLTCFVLSLALVLSDSRAGFLATLAGLFVIFAFGAVRAARRGGLLRALAAAAATFAVMLALLLSNGSSLQDRLNGFMETRGAEELRPVLWTTADHVIADHPLLGTGLGTFRDAYSLYAQEFDPFIVDRVHNDYLELALGLGIPAALIWVGSFCWLTFVCALGVLRRRRRRVYALAAVGCATLVAIHSAVDFSLQMPAVSILFAAIMAVGLAQSSGSSETESSRA
jgi:O-antigen ligase